MWDWILAVSLVASISLVLWSSWNFRQAQKRVLELLKERGPMTGLELSEAGIPRSSTYLVLNRLEMEGKVASFLTDTPKWGGQKKYKAVR